jgi:alkylhydroperoxidase family enzyme
MQNADEDAVSAAREGGEIEDAKVDALYRFARSLVAKKGHVSTEETKSFLDAGYSRAALFEVVAQVGHTTLTNLAHSVSDAPLDEQFMPQAWTKAAA